MQKKDNKSVQQNKHVSKQFGNNVGAFNSAGLPNFNETKQQSEVNNNFPSESNALQQKNFLQTPVDHYNQQYSQPQLMPNMQQMPVNQAWQYPPNIYSGEMGQYTRENNFACRYDSSNGLASFSKQFSDFLKQSGDLQIGLVEGQKNILSANIKGVWGEYIKQEDDDDKKNKEKCKQNDERHKEEMDKFEKNLDKEKKNIEGSLKNLIKNVFNNIDDNLYASKSGYIAIYKSVSDLVDTYKSKVTENSEDYKGAYSELQQDLSRMMDNYELVSTTGLRDSLLRYNDFIGKKYSLNIFYAFFYSLVDLFFGTNYHKDFHALSENTKEILAELSNANKMSKENQDDSAIKIMNLANKHKQILSAMPTGLFEPQKESEVDFLQNIDACFKVKDFNQADNIFTLFDFLGADIFSEAYRDSNEAKKNLILKLIASKIDFSDPETKKQGAEVFGLGNEKDFWQRKMRIVKFMFETVKEDGEKKINEVLKKINNIDKLTEPLSPELEAQKRVISNYCGGKVSELINRTIGKKFKEKTALQEQLYFVDIINAKNDKFDAQKKRVKKLVSNVINEMTRYYNEQINNVNKFCAYEEMRNVDFSSDSYRRQGYILLTSTLNVAVENLKKDINEELGDYEKGKEDDMKDQKEIIRKGIQERQDDNGKPKDRKALDLKRLQDWDDRNLDEEGYELKEQLLNEVDVFMKNMEEAIKNNFVDDANRSLIGKNKLPEEMAANIEKLQNTYKDIEIKRADANKESYDKMIQMLANGRGGRRESFM